MLTHELRNTQGSTRRGEDRLTLLPKRIRTVSMVLRSPIQIRKHYSKRAEPIQKELLKEIIYELFMVAGKLINTI
jgi:hypothetical protein